MCIIAAMYVLIPDTLVGLFESDHDRGNFDQVAAMVPALLACAALYSLADAVNVTFSFALRGAGDTRFVTLLTFALAWPIMVIPTYVLVRGGGNLLWAWIFNPQVGLLNYGLSFLGIKGPAWLASQQWALPALILMSLWSIGGIMVILLAGLQGVPQSLYDAAKIDGAGPWGQFRHVTLPMISPALFLVVVISTVGSFQIFTNVAVMTQGGPGTSTLVLVYHIYNEAFISWDLGYSSMIALVLFFLVLVVTIVQFKRQRED